MSEKRRIKKSVEMGRSIMKDGDGKKLAMQDLLVGDEIEVVYRVRKVELKKDVGGVLVDAGPGDDKSKCFSIVDMVEI